MPLPHVLHQHVWRPIWDCQSVSQRDGRASQLADFRWGDNKGACAMTLRNDREKKTLSTPRVAILLWRWSTLERSTSRSMCAVRCSLDEHEVHAQ